MKKPFGSKKSRPFPPAGKKKFGGDKPGFKPRKNFDGKPSGEPGGSGERRSFDKPAWKSDRPSWKSDRPEGRDDNRKFGPSKDRPHSGDKPAWKKDKPAWKSDRPAWKSDKPSYGDKPRYGGTDSNRPRSGDKPAWKSDRPAWKSDKPSYGDKPRYGGTGSDSPRSGDKPAWKSDKPAWKSDRPSYGEKPRYSGSGSDRPRSADKPAWKSDKPAWKSDKPNWKSERPSYGDKPRYGGPNSDQSSRGDKPAWKSDKPAWKTNKPAWTSDSRKRPEDRPAWKPGDDVTESPRSSGDEVYSRGSVSVPSNKKNYSEGGTSLSRKPFAARIPAGSPNAKSLIVTLSDTNNVPVRLVWIYESMVGELPDGEPAPGDTVYVHDESHRFIGSAIYNPNSRIRARIFSLTRRRFDEDYLRETIAEAVARRRQLGLLKQSCRVVFGESDGIPGLIADKIGDYLVIQPLTFAVNRYLSFIVDQLNGHLAPEGIVVRTDVPIRAKEGLAVEPPAVHGDVPERVKVVEEDCTVFANLAGGQKTGLFLDQRYNRTVMKPFSKGARVLDLFCHVGGWALAAAYYGAETVVGVDSSKSALELAEAGASEMGLSNVSFVENDVFEYLRSLDTEPDSLFDIIVCDPPAFAKTRQHYEEAFRAYLSLNYLVMKKLKPGGLLVTCSCSQAVSTVEFNEAILTAARNARMQFQVLERRGAPADHPVLLGLPETEYLKCQVMLRTE